MVDCERYLLDAGKRVRIDTPFKGARAKLSGTVFKYLAMQELFRSSLTSLTNDLIHTDMISLIWKIKRRTNPPAGAVGILERDRDKIRNLWDIFIAFKTNDQIDVKKVYALRELVLKSDIPIPTLFEVILLKYKSFASLSIT